MRELKHGTLSKLWKCAPTFDAHVCPFPRQDAEVSFVKIPCMKAVGTHTATDASVQGQWCSDFASHHATAARVDVHFLLCQCDVISQKITTILDGNGHFHKTSPLYPDIERSTWSKNASLLKKKCTLNAEGPNLACRREPNLACHGCQASLSSFSNSTEHPVCIAREGRVCRGLCWRSWTD